jgi:glycerol uptake facilitator protein
VPVVVGLLVLAIARCTDSTRATRATGRAISGPRLFTAVAGRRRLRAGNACWSVPIVAPPIGGVLGGWIYDVLVGDRFGVRLVEKVE